ncbi:hypothetical protein NMY22_g452 [Coprinellus aureogranulatus]|nr:hypothetical protein NMY22_g452 [Coprinellus aureogranulatus]
MYGSNVLQSSRKISRSWLRHFALTSGLPDYTESLADLFPNNQELKILARRVENWEGLMTLGRQDFLATASCIFKITGTEVLAGLSYDQTRPRPVDFENVALVVSCYRVLDAYLTRNKREGLVPGPKVPRRDIPESSVKCPHVVSDWAELVNRFIDILGSGGLTSTDFDRMDNPSDSRFIIMFKNILQAGNNAAISRVFGNIYACCMYLMFLCDPSSVEEPLTVSNVRDFLNRGFNASLSPIGQSNLSLSSSDRQGLSKIAKPESLKGVELCLEVCFLGSPILLLQTFNVAKRKWIREGILQSLRCLGNEKPPAMEAVEDVFYDTIFEVAFEGRSCSRRLADKLDFIQRAMHQSNALVPRWFLTQDVGSIDVDDSDVEDQEPPLKRRRVCSSEANQGIASTSGAGSASRTGIASGKASIPQPTQMLPSEPIFHRIENVYPTPEPSVPPRTPPRGYIPPYPFESDWLHPPPSSNFAPHFTRGNAGVSTMSTDRSHQFNGSSVGLTPLTSKAANPANLDFLNSSDAMFAPTFSSTSNGFGVGSLSPRIESNAVAVRSSSLHTSSAAALNGSHKRTLREYAPPAANQLQHHPFLRSCTPTSTHREDSSNRLNPFVGGADSSDGISLGKDNIGKAVESNRMPEGGSTTEEGQNEANKGGKDGGEMVVSEESEVEVEVEAEKVEREAQKKRKEPGHQNTRRDDTFEEEHKGYGDDEEEDTRKRQNEWGDDSERGGDGDEEENSGGEEEQETQKKQNERGDDYERGDDQDEEDRQAARYSRWRMGGVVDGEQVALVVQRDGKLKENDPHLAHAHAVSPVVVDVGDEYQAALPMPTEVVITYISRQSARNRKKNDEREALLLKYRGNKKGEVPPPWTFDLLEAEHLSKDEQVRAAARTTILLGVHGNGLSSLIWMKPTRVSSVIEIFCPPGFAHDYWWTTRSLGMRHWAMWNDTSKTWPDKPEVNYPDCFQRDEIPVHGPAVAKLIEDRVEGKL